MMATAMERGMEQRIQMAGSKSDKDIRQADIVKPKHEDAPGVDHSDSDISVLTALSGSLRFGTPPSLSAEKSIEAAGALGNQNVLKLMETGAESRRTIEDLGTDTDTKGLAEALSGQPDGPVCDMGTLL